MTAHILDSGVQKVSGLVRRERVDLASRATRLELRDWQTI